MITSIVFPVVFGNLQEISRQTSPLEGIIDTGSSATAIGCTTAVELFSGKDQISLSITLGKFRAEEKNKIDTTGLKPGELQILEAEADSKAAEKFIIHLCKDYKKYATLSRSGFATGEIRQVAILHTKVRIYFGKHFNKKTEPLKIRVLPCAEKVPLLGADFLSEFRFVSSKWSHGYLSQNFVKPPKFISNNILAINQRIPFLRNILELGNVWELKFIKS